VVRVSFRAAKYGDTIIFNVHFDDPQTVMQTQTVDERVIN